MQKTLEAVCARALAPALARENEKERLFCLERAIFALRQLEAMGFVAGLFGSALRPGEFFGGSDADLAAYLPDLSEVGAGAQRHAKIACCEAMRDIPFDLVFLPTLANPAFGERVKTQWMVSADWISARMGSGRSLLRCPFTFDDVIFIDTDRAVIARNAALRLWSLAATPESADMALLSCSRSVSEGLCRIGDKCAKDVLRHFLKLAAPLGSAPALLPLLRLPAEINQGQPIASEELEMAYWALRQASDDLAQNPPAGEALRQRAQGVAELGFLFAAALDRDVVGFARSARESEKLKENLASISPGASDPKPQLALAGSAL